MSKKKGTEKELSDQEVERFEKAFTKVTGGKKTKISMDEIYELLERAQERFDKEDVLDAADVSLGKNEYDEYSLYEVLQIIAEMNSADPIIDAFEVFDKDKNGYITVNEFKAILKMVKSNLSDEELEDIFKISDISEDGKIDYQEFVHFWHSQ
ncbi:MAG: EF-hand domain-containing protein [archaeon]|nr:EF-hand domain-containing protein [archaeon]